MSNFDILTIQSNKSTYRIETQFEENDFKITIFLETLDAFHTHVTHELLMNLAKERNRNAIDYYKDLKQYLMHPDTDITFDINPSKDNVAFTIKRKVSGRTLLFFSVILERVNFHESIFNIIDTLLGKNKNISKDVELLKEKQSELQKEKQMFQDKLTEFVNIKTIWEQEMYSNFIILLNEKKKRIKFLTDLLTRKNINPDEEQLLEMESLQEEPTTSITRLETISDSSSSSEYDTDKDKSNEDSEEDTKMEPMPTTSKQILEMDEDEPPLLCLPKLTKKPKEKQVVLKVKQSQEATCKILNDNTQTQEKTQEPYLSTQDMIDRLG